MSRSASRTLPLTGGCLCGAVRYSVAEVFRESTMCHCRMCQRQSGAPFMGFLTVRRETLSLAGEVRRYRSSPFAARGFCPMCGSALTFEYDHEPDLIGLTIGTLDEPDAVPPTMHWGVESQLSWLKLADGLPRRSTDDDPDFVAAVGRGEASR